MANQASTELAGGGVDVIYEALAFTRGRLALISDLIEGDGTRPKRDFSLSAYSVETLLEMLLEMEDKLNDALDALKAGEIGDKAS